MEPVVTIVIPTYKRPRYLKRAVESVLNQTYSKIELIVVDDNNPDTPERMETEEVMARYSDDSRVQYLKHDRNKNGSAARNTGWRQSSGKYITFIDDDDEIASSKIEKQVRCLEALDSSWGSCYTGYKLVKEHGKTQISCEKRRGDCYMDALMKTLFMGSGSNLFLRKSVVDEINGYDESFLRNQDIEFMTRALEHYKIAYIDEILLTIYQEGDREVRTFEQLDGNAKQYIEKFKDRIDKLSKEDRKQVIAVISLERCRIAFYKKEIIAGLKILKDNHVNLLYILKYFIYLAHRILTHKSYGFTGKLKLKGGHKCV